uniref:Uncharacterized protein n=1 Tax=Pipistrellus kuhlii TaxID=59472 RepID=A0A7J7UGF4_PIPKU|nr:hypothetical protein mPipKuh1_009082 [Pipistrellus kuhlii]
MLNHTRLHHGMETLGAGPLSGSPDFPLPLFQDWLGEKEALQSNKYNFTSSTFHPLCRLLEMLLSVVPQEPHSYSCLRRLALSFLQHPRNQREGLCRNKSKVLEIRDTFTILIAVIAHGHPIMSEVIK